MDCLESRKLLLSIVASHNDEHEVHITHCGVCKTLVTELGRLQDGVRRALCVPVPEGLADRVLLARRAWRIGRNTIAAVLSGMAATVGLFAAGVVELPLLTHTAQAVGPGHPAVAAIAEVLNELPSGSDQMQIAGRTAVEQSLLRHGLTLNRRDVEARYLGRCHLPGTTECEHIRVRTAEASGDVMLIRDHPFPDRVLVSDRNRAALVNPIASGGYIVVAATIDAAKSIAKIFSEL